MHWRRSLSSSRTRSRNARRPGNVLVVALLSMLLLSQTIAGVGAVYASGPGDSDPELYKPVLAEQRDAVIGETAGTLSRFRIDATFTPTSGTTMASIAGDVDLRFVNSTPDALDELYFRLYPNNEEYESGGMTIDRVTLDGEELAVSLSVGDTVATVSLPDSLEPDDAIDLHISFTTTIPNDPIGSYGMFSYDEQHTSYALAHWLPLLAGYDPESGWLLDPPSQNGDPVFTNTALFDVTLTAPSDLVFVTTGSEIKASKLANGRTKHHYLSGPVRDFVMAADVDFEVESIAVGGTMVNSYFNTGSRDGGLAVLTAGAQALQVYNDLFGEYPYEEMDLVQIDLGNGAGGVEFPQLMFIGSDYYSNSASIPHFLEFIVAHEVAHQWWYGLVGNDQYAHAFMDEALANFVTTVYFGEIYGPDSEKEQVNYNLKTSYFAVLFNAQDEIVDQPSDAFRSQRTYGAIIYGKGALAFAAVRDAIGNKAFYAGLQEYYADYRFQVATPAEMKAAFEDASGQNLDELWRHWFDSAEGRKDFNAADLANLLKEIGR